MSEMPYVCLYRSYYTSLAQFSDEEIGRLMKSMLRYLVAGEPGAMPGNERFVWPMLRDQLDRDIAAYEQKCQTNRRNAQKKGKKAAASDGKQTLAMAAKEKENEKEKEKEKENENESENKKEKEKGAFVPPDLQQVLEYCIVNNCWDVSPERFLEHYRSRGWMLGDRPMEDWQAALRGWKNRPEAAWE